MKLEEFRIALEKCRHALSKQETVPALQHFFFRDGYVWAYNDQIAIRTRCACGLTGAIEGQPLLKAVKSHSADEISFEPVVRADGEVEDSALKISLSRSSVFHLPILGEEDIVFEWPEFDVEPVEVGDELLEAIKLGRISISKKNDRLDMSGFTFFISEETGCVYSSNSATISAFVVGSLTGEASQFLLAENFGRAYIALSGYLGEGDHVTAYIGQKAVLFDFSGKAELFVRKVNVEPLDYPAVLEKNLKDLDFVSIPEGFSECLQRSMAVAGKDPIVYLSCKEEGELEIHASSASGSYDETLSTDPLDEFEGFAFQAEYLIRVLKSGADQMAVNTRKKCLVFRKGNFFTHLISTRHV